MPLLSMINNPTETYETIPYVHSTNNLPISSTSGPSSDSLSHPEANSSSSSIPVVALELAQNIISNISANNNTGTKMFQNFEAPWFEIPKVKSFADAFSLSCSIAMVFGGSVPYIPQYLKIKRSLNSEGFSTYVCLTLLLANILRVMFWFGHRFELPLLIQSFVMIASMLAMMEICIRVRVRDKGSPDTISASNTDPQHRIVYDIRTEEAIIAVASTSNNDSSKCNDGSSEFPIPSKDLSSQQCQASLMDRSSPTRTFKCSKSCRFWDWDDYFSYVKFLSLFTFIISLLTYLLKSNYLYVESLGFVAMFMESMLGMPQLVRNFTKKSTAGMSVEMVIMWLLGDLFKTLYFILRKAPVQFYVCGSIQVSVDIIILGQVLWYKRPNATDRKLPKST